MLNKNKIHYTKAEIDKLTPEEIMELTTFGTDGRFFYSEVFTTKIDEDGFTVNFKNGHVAHAKTREAFDDIRMGKIRYDLCFRGVDEANDLKRIKSEVLKDVTKNFGLQVEKLQSDVGDVVEDQKVLMLQHSDAITNALRDVSEQVNTSIGKLENSYKTSKKTMEEKMDKLVSSHNSKVDNIRKLNVDKIHMLMEDIEAISKAFNSLLK